jgi:lipopolysaccharide biosynthesis glycosyltransferase
LDADVIVLGDITDLYAQGDRLTEIAYLGAVPQFFPAPLYFSNPFKVWSEVRQFKKTFNSGVLLTDLRFWQAEVYSRLQYYLDLDAQYGYRLYHLGDETVMNLMFKQDYVPLDSSWNRCGYGNARVVTWFLPSDLSQIKIIHWSGGHHKPWRSKNIRFGELWYQYRPETLPAA